MKFFQNNLVQSHHREVVLIHGRKKKVIHTEKDTKNKVCSLIIIFNFISKFFYTTNEMVEYNNLPRRANYSRFCNVLADCSMTILSSLQSLWADFLA